MKYMIVDLIAEKKNLADALRKEGRQFQRQVNQLYREVRQLETDLKNGITEYDDSDPEEFCGL